MKVYNRDLNSLNELNNSLNKVFLQIEKNSKVLDIGCGSAALGEKLVSEKNCYVVGAEYSEESIKVAQEKINKTIKIDLNNENLESKTSEQFDVIIMADILEHIYSPNIVLKSVEKLLKPNGKVIISIPNAGYTGALLSLYDDEWQYREEGILDSTHIRFYTKKSILKLLNDNGFNAVICDRVLTDLTGSEFTQRIDCLNDSVKDWLLAKPEGATYQFIIEARPNSQNHLFPIEKDDTPMSFLHITKLFWKNKTDTDYSDKKVVFQRGIMGSNSQNNELVFPLHTINDDRSISEIRFDFADRKSTYYINDISIYDDLDLVWQASREQGDINIIIHDGFMLNQHFPSQFNANSNQTNCIISFPAPIIVNNKLIIKIKMSAPISEQNLCFYNAKNQSESNMLIELNNAKSEIKYLKEIAENRKPIHCCLTKLFNNFKLFK